MKYTEALTALIDKQYGEMARIHASVPALGTITRDEIATECVNVRIAASVMGNLNSDALYQADDVEYDTFDNCREYGLTVAVGGWTFCAYEHRNSDSICIEGCPDDAVQAWGPYGGEDKYDVLASFPYGRYYDAVEALEGMIATVRRNPAATRADVQLEGGKR